MMKLKPGDVCVEPDGSILVHVCYIRDKRDGQLSWFEYDTNNKDWNDGTLCGYGVYMIRAFHTFLEKIGEL